MRVLEVEKATLKLRRAPHPSQVGSGGVIELDLTWREAPISIVPSLLLESAKVCC